MPLRARGASLGGASRTSTGSRVRGTTPASTELTVGQGRLRMVLALVALAGILLGGRAAYLSVWEGGASSAFAFEPVAETQENGARGRGDIVSADGRRLATSLEKVRVQATPYQIEDPERTARELAEILGPATRQDAADIEELLTRRDADGELAGYSVLGTVEPAVAEEVSDLDVEGIHLVPDAVRVYPDRDLASQLTGYLGDYGQAFGGVEASHDETLQTGEDVRLTLDAAVQQELEASLEKMLKENKAKNTLGLVLRIEDGAIVALANSPGYDNNHYGQAPAEAQRDRVLVDPYEPGSTFKPFTIAAALETDAITPSTTFTVPDQIPVSDRIIRDSLPHETWLLGAGGILEKSSNVGTIKIARALGGDVLEDYIRRFGFGERTGVDLLGEDPGLVPPYEDWSGSSIGNIPIGQGLTVTPLQLAAGYATLAGGGEQVTPHVAEGGGASSAGTRVISEETSAIVREMLRGVVEEGSGHLAQVPGYTVAGKTGTSQKVDPETGAYGDEYVSSFIGFAPATDPEYVVLIVADEPQTSFWGEEVAAPAFQEVMSFTLGYFNVAPDDARSGSPDGGSAGESVGEAPTP